MSKQFEKLKDKAGLNKEKDRSEEQMTEKIF